MIQNLVIVESPAKAKTIGKFLGKDFQVLSSYGHIRDLSPHKFSVDIEHGYAPKYEIPTDKKKLVKDLKSAASSAEVIWLASDEDREGEAIAWHLSEVLDIKDKTVNRIVFHEITKPAIQNAIQNPRSINNDLVDAQQARRVLDRIVGFELSPVLWKRIKPSLSAGRVQSVAVRIIVEREREIAEFKTQSQYKTTAQFLLSDKKTILEAELNHKFSTEEEARQYLELCSKGQFKVRDIVKKPGKRSPAGPFTTSTLQQEAARKLGYSVAQTMRIAQKLYEDGHITYMRTDSMNLSALAINDLSNLIKEQYGEQYLQVRKYHQKAKGAQEAHEAIRPTYVSKEKIAGTAQEKKLYDLIRKRTIASQMADMLTERTTIYIESEGLDHHFSALGEVVLFSGFYSVYKEDTDDDQPQEENTNLLPKVEVNEALTLKEAKSTERFTQRPARYTEASLVKKLEELGIGRPSTYAPTIQTIQQREYVIKGDREGKKRNYVQLELKDKQINKTELTETYGADKNKLIPTDIGIVVNDFLVEQFGGIVDLNFTAKVEDEFDHIAEGKLQWNKVIDSFYKKFHPKVEEAASISKQEERVGERILGTDPKTGLQVSVRIGRYGPMAQLGTTEDEDQKPRFASLPQGKSIVTISLEEVLDLFAMPKDLGEFEGKTITIGIGRFGPYVRHNNKFVSIPKGTDPLDVTYEEAIELIKNKREAEEKSIIKIFDEEPDLQVRVGRFGPYIKYQGSNYKIAKGTDAQQLSLDDCKKIIEEAPKKKSRAKSSKTTKSKSSKKATK